MTNNPKRILLKMIRSKFLIPEALPVLSALGLKFHEAHENYVEWIGENRGNISIDICEVMNFYKIDGVIVFPDGR